MRKTIFILSWPSWVGKTTLWHNLLNEKDDIKIEKVITTTTRKPRDWEVNGKDYYFVSIEDFWKLIKENKLVEWAEVHNNFYWSTYQELERIIKRWYKPLYIVDPQWSKYLKKVLSDKYKVVTVFILPPSIEELKQRLLKRWEDPNSEAFKIRLNESLVWINDADHYDYKIVNDNLEDTINKLKNIFLNE